MIQQHPSTTPEARSSNARRVTRGLLAGLLASLFFAASAQAQWATNGSHIYNSNSGSVGINTQNPQQLLDVRGKIQVGNDNFVSKVVSNPASSRFTLEDTTGSQFRLIYSNFLVFRHTTGGEALRITTDGKVGIGTDSPASELAVDGTITAREIEVTQEGWPDYVFDEDYPLLSLAEVEASIRANKHLPGVPSADDVLENGVAVGAMQSLLLQKIEELTLYMIELEKDNQELSERVASMEAQR